MKIFKSGLEQLASCFVVVMALVSLGCGSDGGGGTQPGVLGVSLTDAPACGFDEVNVTVSKVRVHQSSSANEQAAGWREISLNPPRKINLLNLNDPTQPNFALESLGETSLDPGHYTQLRLVLVPNSNNPNDPWANSIVLSSDPNNEIPLDTPSGIQTGVKLIHQFTVQSGQRVDLLLDFDACHSIVQTGNNTYKLKPVIKVIPYVLNGIEGYLDLALFPGGLNTNHVAVSAQVGGEIIRAVVPNSSVDQNNPNRGKFFIPRLTPGNYDVVITARNSPTDTCCATAVITGVLVPTDTSITEISTLGHPFTLEPSTFHTIGDTVGLINPPPAPAIDDREDATVTVAARQSLTSGPTVTVRSQVAPLKYSTGTVGDYEYGLVLPVAAPSRGAYGSLPIPLTPTLVGGSYFIHGSAQTPTVSYSTQNPTPLPANISTNDVLSADFTLEPVAP